MFSSTRTRDAGANAKRRPASSEEMLGAARIERVRVKRTHLDLERVFARLAELEINDVLVESGSRFAGALFAAGLVDEWLLYVAPKLLGKDARPLMALPRISTPAGCARVRASRIDADRPGYPAASRAAIAGQTRREEVRSRRVHRHRAGSRAASSVANRARVRQGPICASRLRADLRCASGCRSAPASRSTACA